MGGLEGYEVWLLLTQDVMGVIFNLEIGSRNLRRQMPELVFRNV